MAYYDDVPLDFDTREQQLLQQAARIKALRGTAAAPIEAPGESTGWNSAVTGTHIGGRTLKTPTAALLQPLIGQLGADYQEGQMNRARTGLNAEEQQDALAKQAAMGNAPSQADVISGQTNPILKATLAKKYEDTLIQAPAREATRQIEVLKLTQQAREAEANRKNALEAARIRASQETLVPITDSAGNVQLVGNKSGNMRPPTIAGQPAPGAAAPGAAPATPGTPPAEDTRSGIPGQAFLPGMVPLGSGKASDTYLKHNSEIATSHNNAVDGLNTLDNIEKLIGSAETSPARAVLGAGEQFFTGKSTPQMDALNAMKLQAAELRKFADRKMFGPQFSNQDVVDIKSAVGNFEAAQSDTQRQVAIDSLRKIFQRQLAGGAVTDPRNPTAIKPKGGGAPAKIGGQSEFDALEPGTRFVGPDGIPRIKP